MKSLYKIFVFFFAFVALCSCEQKSLVGPENNDKEDIDLSSGDYIFFNVNRLTRGTLLADYLKAPFDVVGYKYQTAWNTVKVQASQYKELNYKLNNETENQRMGVFYSLSNNVTGVQKVNYEGGAHSYTTGAVGTQILKGWLGELRYSFFAWYPSGLGYNNQGGTIAPANVEGNPYITYTLPIGTDKAARQSMQDVMTACVLDVTKYNGATVNFTMKHRLAALDMLAMNIIVDKELKKEMTAMFGPEGEDVEGFDMSDVAENTRTAVVKVENCSLTLDKIKASVRIPLNTEPDLEGYLEEQTPITGEDWVYLEDKTYTGFDCGTSIPYYSTEDDLIALMASEVKDENGVVQQPGEKLILIPQTDDIEATIKLKYNVTCGKHVFTFDRTGTNLVVTYGIKNGETVTTKGTHTTEIPSSLTTTLNGLQEGYYHYMLFTFTASGVFVKAQVEETWSSVRVDYEFE